MNKQFKVPRILPGTIADTTSTIIIFSTGGASIQLLFESKNCLPIKGSGLPGEIEVLPLRAFDATAFSFTLDYKVGNQFS